MARPGASADRPDPGALLDAVGAEAARRADAWFPGLDRDRVRVRLLGTDVRARCFLSRVELDDGRVRRTVVVKERHSRPALRRLDRFQDRPILTPERTMSDEETARREYDGLQHIVDALAEAGADDRFGKVRPLAWLPDGPAIVMDHIDEPTLRRRLLDTGRLRRRRRQPMDETAWLNAGAWLRLFHDHAPGWHLPSRTSTAGEVGELYRAYAEFLAERIRPTPLLTDLAREGSDLAGYALPAELPLAPGHGDFVANNLFAGATGRITGFDPLVRWRVPRYQDLATLTVGIRILPLQAATQGLALDTDALDSHEAAVLRGYHGDEPVPLGAVRAYQLLVLLDRWADLVSKRVPHGTLKPRLHELRIQLASSHCHREARRLLSTVTAKGSAA